MGKPKILEEIDNITSRLADVVTEQSAQSTSISTLETNKAEKNEVNSLATAKANQVDLVVERGRIDNLVATSSGSFYEKCTSGDTGALLVVSSGATTGQINLASVTPVATGYTPAVNDYVKFVYGVASGSAELIDTRVGADGITYSSAGESIRKQIININEQREAMGVNKFNKETTKDGYYVSYTTGVLAANADYFASDYIPVQASTNYIIYPIGFTSGYSLQVAFYDTNKNYISGVGAGGFTTPGTTVYLKFSCQLSFKNVLMLTKGTIKYANYIPYFIVKEDYLLKSYGYNPNALRFTDFSVGYENATSVSIDEDTCIVDINAIGNGDIYFNRTSSVAIGEFVFFRAKVKPSSNIALKVYIMGDTSMTSYVYYNLKAGIEYDIYLRTNNYVSNLNGNMQIQFRVMENDLSTCRLEISDFCVTINNYDCWYDKNTKDSAKDFNGNSVIVDANGNGHFFNINDACDFAKKAYDVANNPFTIYIKNGYYLQRPTNVSPYAPINKGANKINLKGESRDGVIIECYNTSTTQSKVIDVGGECTVENLTVRSLNDGTYNVGNDLGHNAYCIHNDTPYDISEKYYTVIKNCKLYSNCHSPIGAGLQSNQTQRYEKCEFISDGIISNGALYVHAPALDTASNCSVEIDGCNCISKDGTQAIQMHNVVGSLEYVNIDCTFTRNIAVSNGSSVVDSDFKTNHKITIESALNNIGELNY